MVLKVIKLVNIYKICLKYYVMAINQHLWNIALTLQSIQEVFLPILPIISFAPFD